MSSSGFKPPQLDLFGHTAPEGISAPLARAARETIGPAEVPEPLRRLGEGLPQGLWMGTSSWFFPGWEGIVFERGARSATSTELARHGLEAYAQHPLLRAVGIDRTFYAPVTTEVFQAYAAVVPAQFRFVVKAHDALTLARFPMHRRYGARQGERNPLFLDAGYAEEAVVRPFVEGLSEKGGALVFQFPPQHPEDLPPEVFPEVLEAFLSQLPKGPQYAVEVRNPELLTPRLAQALAATNTIPVLNVWGPMPALELQAKVMRAFEASAAVVRWMLPRHRGYEEARAFFAPFDRLVEVDARARDSILRVSTSMLVQNKPVYIVVNNKAEGSAPLSVFALSKAFAEARLRA